MESGKTESIFDGRGRKYRRHAGLVSASQTNVGTITMTYYCDAETVPAQNLFHGFGISIIRGFIEVI